MSSVIDWCSLFIRDKRSPSLPLPLRFEMTTVTFNSVKQSIGSLNKTDIFKSPFPDLSAVPVVVVDDVPNGKVRIIFLDGSVIVIP